MQGDMEKSIGLPVSHLCDRFTANVPAGQVQSRHTPDGGLISAAGSHPITPLPPRGAQVLHSNHPPALTWCASSTFQTHDHPRGHTLQAANCFHRGNECRAGTRCADAEICFIVDRRSDSSNLLSRLHFRQHRSSSTRWWERSMLLWIIIWRTGSVWRRRRSALLTQRLHWDSGRSSGGACLRIWVRTGRLRVQLARMAAVRV